MVGSFGVARLIWVKRGGRWFHSGSLGSIGCNLRVSGFIQVRWLHSRSPWGSVASFGVAGFIWVRPGGR